jgi:hypothetical protein
MFMPARSGFGNETIVYRTPGYMIKRRRKRCLETLRLSLTPWFSKVEALSK